MTSTVEVDQVPAMPEVLRSRRFYWLLLVIVFVGGVCSVAIELTASRLLGPYFGDSTLIWANVIGLTLLYLSVGYWVGGRVVDRWPSATLLFCITAIAGFFTGFIPIVSQPILHRSLSAFSSYSIGAFAGSLVGVLLLFAIPITLLGFVSPFAIRLRVLSVDSAGNTAGSLYALSTVGSILGSFLPVLLLIPWIGTYRTFYAFAIALLATSIVGLLLLRQPLLSLGSIVMVGVVVAVAILWSGGPVRPPEYGHIVFEEESQYNYIQVVKDGSAYILSLNDGHAEHSYYDPTKELTGGYWDYISVAPFFNRDYRPGQLKSAAIIGLAAGTMAKQLTNDFGPIPIDGVELDPKIVAVGRKYFDMHEPNLHVYTEDGRYFLSTTNKKYDLIAVDAYRQPYIPFQMTTREFFQEVRNHLTPDGVVAINVGRTTTDYRLVRVLATTMRTVYPNVYIIDVPGWTNSIVVGTNMPTQLQDFKENVAMLASGPLKVVGNQSVTNGNLRVWNSTDPAWVYTDDHAPIERIINDMIIDAAEGHGK